MYPSMFRVATDRRMPFRPFPILPRIPRALASLVRAPFAARKGLEASRSARERQQICPFRTAKGARVKRAGYAREDGGWAGESE